VQDRSSRRILGYLSLLLLSSLCASAQLHPGLSPTYAPPNKANISTLLKTVDSADRVEVFEMNGLSVGRRVYQSESHDDLMSLKASMKPIVPSPLCACSPSTIVRLFRHGKQTGAIEIMSGNIISFTSWTGDARIVNTKPWFD